MRVSYCGNEQQVELIYLFHFFSGVCIDLQGHWKHIAQ